MKVISFAQNAVSSKGGDKIGQSNLHLNKDGSIPLNPMAAREETLLSVVVKMKDAAAASPIVGDQSLLQQSSTSEMNLDLKLLGLKRGTQNGQEIAVSLS